MTNPFAVLSVDKAVSKSEILKQVAVAMRTKQYDTKTIAEAQKELFSPMARAAAEFEHFIDIERCIGPLRADDVRDGDAPDLNLLECFDEEGTVER